MNFRPKFPLITFRNAALFLITLAWVGLGIGKIEGKVFEVSPLNIEDNKPQGEGFISRGAFGDLSKKLKLKKILGSFRKSDEDTGRFISPWFQESSPLIYVSGYPNLHGNSLFLEVKRKEETQKLLFADLNPGETWHHWRPNLPSDTQCFRIVAVDERKEHRGWLAFSLPLVKADLPPLVRAFTSLALAIALYVGAGLVIHSYLKKRVPLSISILLSPIYLAVLGLAIWLLVGDLSSQTLSFAFVSITLGVISYKAIGVDFFEIDRSDKTAVLIYLLIVLVASGKSLYSLGPPDELFRGTISRTLETSMRPDSRISFHTIQLISNGLTTTEKIAERLYSPWNFSHRGPLAGLAISPMVLSIQGSPPIDFPDAPWDPFDKEGFMAFRFGMIALSALSIFSVYGLTKTISGPGAAQVGALLAALSPFFVHELFYTWPKMITAGYVISGFHLLALGRSALSGLFVGLSYLFHPLSLLSLPFIGLWCVLNPLIKERKGIRESLLRGVYFGAPILLILVFWFLINSSNFKQSGFLSYFSGALGYPTDSNWYWIWSRIDSALSTFFPFFALLFHYDHPAITGQFGNSPFFVRFAFQFWNTLPLGIGIIAFLVSIPILIKRCAANLFEATILFFMPSAFLVAFWGAPAPGIMMECGHVLFLSFVVSVSLFAHPFLTSRPLLIWPLQGVQVAIVLFLPVIPFADKILSASFQVSDLFALLTSGMALLALVMLGLKLQEPKGWVS